MPYFSLPFYNFNTYNRYRRNVFYNASKTPYNHANSTNTTPSYNTKKDDSSTVQNCNSNLDSDSKKEDSNESPIFDIFGIKLYFDDILLIVLIYFLYKEEVKDEGLFVTLILLLLS